MVAPAGSLTEEDAHGDRGRDRGGDDDAGPRQELERCLHDRSLDPASDGMGAIKYGPARMPSRESPEAATGELQARGLSACEIDFESKFWMDYGFAERLGALAREHGIALSVHAPLAGFMGHVEHGGRKHQMAVGMLDHTAGLAQACGAAPVVIHPGFLLGRTREGAIDAVVQQLTDLGRRLESKGRLVPFGIEVMGRVHELGTLDDVLAISAYVASLEP